MRAHWADDELFYDINLTAIICSHFVGSIQLEMISSRNEVFEAKKKQEIISGLRNKNA